MPTPSISAFIESLHYLYNNFDREGPEGADVYILCLEEFSSVGMLPPGGSSMFRILPPGTFQELLFALPANRWRSK